MPFKITSISGVIKTFHEQKLYKSFTNRTRFCDKFLKKLSFRKSLTQSPKNICWPHYCGKFGKKHSRIINEKDVTDNRNFWQTLKPLFWDNIKSYFSY